MLLILLVTLGTGSCPSFAPISVFVTCSLHLMSIEGLSSPLPGGSCVPYLPFAQGSMYPTLLADECAHRPDGLPALLHTCPDGSLQQLCIHKKKSCLFPFTQGS